MLNSIVSAASLVQATSTIPLQTPSFPRSLDQPTSFKVTFYRFETSIDPIIGVSVSSDVLIVVFAFPTRHLGPYPFDLRHELADVILSYVNQGLTWGFLLYPPTRFSPPRCPWPMRTSVHECPPSSSPTTHHSISVTTNLMDPATPDGYAGFRAGRVGLFVYLWIGAFSRLVVNPC